MATAFERLFERLPEIAVIMESNEKKKTVKMIKEMPVFSDMTENTIKTNITSFPFLAKELDKIRQDLSNSLAKETDELRKENESLKTELSDIRQDLSNSLDKPDNEQSLNDVMKELQALKERVGAIETTMQGNVSQVLDKNLDKIPINKTSDFIDSWKIVFKDPYYKLYKTVKGKLIWIHIGREFSEDVARKKIRQKLDKM